MCRFVVAGALLFAGCAGPAPPDGNACPDVDADLKPLLEARWSDVTGADGWSQAWGAARRWIEGMLVSHDEWVALGWCDFRADRVEDAEHAFDVAQSRVRHSVDAAIGLGYVALRQARVSEATRLFTFALKNAPASTDAREGMGLALERLREGDAAAAPAAEVLRRIASQATADARDMHLLAMANRRARVTRAP